MTDEELAPHIEEIARVLQDSVEKEELLKEMKYYLYHYRVSLDQAKQGIVRKYGGDPSMLFKGALKKITDLNLNEQSVDLLVRVVSVNEREIETEGGSKTILYGIFGDETGTASFTAWEADRFDLKKGEVYMVRNAYTREWNGKPQINLGNRAVVEKRDRNELPLPEAIQSTMAPEGEIAVGRLRDGMNGVEVTGRILSLEKREVKVGDEVKTVFSGIIADGTGKVQFSAWDDFGLKKGDLIKVKNAYTTSWRGIPQLNFGERASVDKLEIDFPSEEELSAPSEKEIEELETVGGAIDVCVRGVVIDIKKGSGLISRCPECKRQVQSGICRVHGKVKPYPDLRVKGIIDDGTGTITAILNREITESFLGICLDEALEEAKEAMDHGIIRDRIEERLFAIPVIMRGNVTSDEFGLMMIVTEAQFYKEDIRARARDLIAQLEGSA